MKFKSQRQSKIDERKSEIRNCMLASLRETTRRRKNVPSYVLINISESVVTATLAARKQNEIEFKLLQAEVVDGEAAICIAVGGKASRSKFFSAHICTESEFRHAAHTGSVRDIKFIRNGKGLLCELARK